MGKSIRIYLADTDVNGIRHAEIVNWTGQALAFPRNRVTDLKSWPEVRRQGVYFLIGQDDQSGQEAAYIGEAEVVVERIIQHVSQKEFWSECIAFTSKDENLTKSHIKYLESKLVAAASSADRYVVINSSAPQESALPRADKDAMDEFASNIRILLGVLGHRVLEPISTTKQKISPTLTAPQPASQNVEPQNESAAGTSFFMRTSKLSATALLTSNELVVLQNSQAAKEAQASLPPGYSAIRNKLISMGVLKEASDHLVFTRDYPFSSPSQAASIISGSSINGRNTWKNSNGRSLKEIEESEAKQLGEGLLAELDSLNASLSHQVLTGGSTRTRT
ncbi:MAG: GIY-YIG nuclease family protein [Pseudomonadota bacterium]